VLFIESDFWRPETDVQLLNHLGEHKNGQLFDAHNVQLLNHLCANSLRCDALPVCYITFCVLIHVHTYKIAPV
jgi:hypothetical protein